MTRAFYFKIPEFQDLNIYKNILSFQIQKFKAFKCYNTPFSYRHCFDEKTALKTMK